MTQTAASDVVLKHLEEHIDEDVKYTDIAEATDGKNAENIKNIIKRLQKQGIPGCTLTTRGPTACLRTTDPYLFAIRKKQASKAKAEIGQALWKVLLNVDGPECEFRGEEKLDDKLVAIRNHFEMLCIVDSGTSTLSATEALIDTGVPFSVASNDRSKNHLVNVEIITHSVPVLETILRSRYSSAITTHFIGGKIDAGLKCSSGIVANECLPQFQVAGGVAIIGATGYRSESKSFTTNNRDQSYIKARYIEMADISVVITDSRKFINPSAKRSFAAADEIDLVITDDGKRSKCSQKLEDGIDRFISENPNVPIAIVKS